MESWNDLLDTALLGTEKRPVAPAAGEGVLAESMAAIERHTTDREDLFLQKASLLYNYRQCGFVHPQHAAAATSVAPAEEREYAGTLAHSLLHDVLQTGSASLTRLWLEQCSHAKKLVRPEALPVLLDAGTQQAHLRSLIVDGVGHRGTWLQGFNEAWRWPAEDENVWETGTPAQRKAYLLRALKRDPAGAQTLMMQSWEAEPAATKADWLEALRKHATAAAVPWLEAMQAERSTKVKDAALEVLKWIPESTLVQRYWEVLKASVRMVSSRKLLGFGSKKELDIKLAPVDPELFKTGIQSLPSKANISEESFILYQLVGSVPPQWWEAHLEADPGAILGLIAEHKEYHTLPPAFGAAAARFKNREWLRQVMDLHKSGFFTDAFDLLPQRESEAYALRFMQDNDDAAASVLHGIQSFPEEWSPEFAQAVLRYTAKNPYHYNRSFYTDIAALLPTSIVPQLESLAPPEEYSRSVWSGQSEGIARLLSLKTGIAQAFQPVA